MKNSSKASVPAESSTMSPPLPVKLPEGQSKAVNIRKKKGSSSASPPKERKAPHSHKNFFDSLTVIDPSGERVLVPVNKDENNIANQFMASRMRHLLHKQIDRYKEKDVTLLPKELKDLTDSAKIIAEFSGEVYNSSDPIEARGEKKVEPAEVADIDFNLP